MESEHKVIEDLAFKQTNFKVIAVQRKLKEVLKDFNIRVI